MGPNGTIGTFTVRLVADGYSRVAIVADVRDVNGDYRQKAYRKPPTDWL
jgi:hypothetical protein